MPTNIVRACVCACSRTHTHTHVHKCAHKHAHMQTHTYTHTQMWTVDAQSCYAVMATPKGVLAPASCYASETLEDP